MELILPSSWLIIPCSGDAGFTARYTSAEVNDCQQTNHLMFALLTYSISFAITVTNFVNSNDMS